MSVWVWVVIVLVGWFAASLLAAPFMIRYLRHRRRAAVRPLGDEDDEQRPAARHWDAVEDFDP